MDLLCAWRTLPYDVFHSLMRAIILRGANFFEYWPNLLVLIVMSNVLFSLCALRFRKKLAFQVMLERDRQARCRRTSAVRSYHLKGTACAFSCFLENFIQRRAHHHRRRRGFGVTLVVWNEDAREECLQGGAARLKKRCCAESSARMCKSWREKSAAQHGAFHLSPDICAMHHVALADYHGHLLHISAELSAQHRFFRRKCTPLETFFPGILILATAKTAATTMVTRNDAE